MLKATALRNSFSRHRNSYEKTEAIIITMLIITRTTIIISDDNVSHRKKTVYR